MCSKPAPPQVGQRPLPELNEKSPTLSPRWRAMGVAVDHIMGNASRQSVELAGLVGAFAGLALKGGHEDVGDERRFARTRDACDGDDGPHRNGHVDVAEIVF